MDRGKAGCVGYLLGAIVLFSCQFIGSCIGPDSTYKAADNLGFFKHQSR